MSYIVCFFSPYLRISIQSLAATFLARKSVNVGLTSSNILIPVQVYSVPKFYANSATPEKPC